MTDPESLPGPSPAVAESPSNLYSRLMGKAKPEEVSGRIVHGVEEATVVQESCGPIELFKFSGKSSAGLVGWLGSTLRETRPSAALHLRDLVGIDEAFVSEVVRLAREGLRRRKQLALLDPPGRAVELIEQYGASEFVPMLSGEGALREGGSIHEALLRERAALSDLSSRFEVNPLWRKHDQEGAWLCPICGSEVSEVRVWNTKPGLGAFRSMRSHLLERCAAWRAGRRLPMPGTALDAFLQEINRKKTDAETERRFTISQQMETLKERVDSMEDLERSVEEAKRKQLHLLPVDPEADAVAQIAVVYRPLQSVSGDFLDFYSMEDNRFGLSIGDVSGHGVETAIIMGMAKMAFRIRSQALGTVKDLMTHANRDLFTELRRAAFVTGIFAVIDRDTHIMTYVRAGHPPPILRHPKGKCEELEGQGLPFGVDSGQRFAAALQECEVELEPGDAVLFYTDGVIEAGADNAQFGMDRLKAALKAAPGEGSAKEILTSVVGAFDAFLGGSPPGDDVTLICLKIQ
jgi:serine phosphatase RsbU (regulator of sigma subunit)